MQESDSDQPSGETREPLLTALFRDVEALLRQEFALLRAETHENLGKIGNGALIAFAGLLVTLIGGLVLTAALVALFGAVMPLWLSCTLVGGIICAAGASLVIYGRRVMSRASLLPRQTLRSLQETGEWLSRELA